MANETLNSKLIFSTFSWIFKATNAIRKIMPMLDRILVQRADALTKTQGGIVLPEQSQAKMMQGTVIAVGPGARNNVSSPQLLNKSFILLQI